jgi:branched-chain amino acid aminotransferase
LWLDPKERKYVGKAGTSRIFSLAESELLTAALGDTILSGFTGHSVIEFATYWGVEVAKQSIPIEEVVDGCKSGRLREMFATGTAAVISPVGEIRWNGSDLKVGNSNEYDFGEQGWSRVTSKQHLVFHAPCL